MVIPTVQHLRLLSELHYSHIGVVKMKETVRNIFGGLALQKIQK